jgi:catechol 2,3-dioxygenase-like lactoylglutathione lyase family enzyme
VELAMERVLGIGGVFLRFRDREGTARWYRDHLGLDVQEGWWGTSLPLRDPDDRPSACVVWSAFAPDTTYFGDPRQAVMVNYRVRNLDAIRGQLLAAGCDVDPKVERSDYGAFGWVTDPEGNRIELWEPPERMPGEG